MMIRILVGCVLENIVRFHRLRMRNGPHEMRLIAGRTLDKSSREHHTVLHNLAHHIYTRSSAHAFQCDLKKKHTKVMEIPLNTIWEIT